METKNGTYSTDIVLDCEDERLTLEGEVKRLDGLIKQSSDSEHYLESIKRITVADSCWMPQHLYEEIEEALITCPEVQYTLDGIISSHKKELGKEIEDSKKKIRGFLE